MQISFYVLSERFLDVGTVSNSEAVLNFVCKLTQTVLQKSEHSLVIVDDDSDRLVHLDKQLWQFDDVSFIPHDLLMDVSNSSVGLNATSEIDIQNNITHAQHATQHTAIQVNDISAPVTLVSTLPQGFDGVVLNLAKTPLPLINDSPATPERVLEIIAPDEVSKQHGRDKYKCYQSLGFELIHFPIA